MRLAAEVLRFGVTGGLATAAHLGLFALLATGAGIDPVAANALAVLGASAVTYLGQRFWVFRGRAGPGGAGRILRFALGLGLAAGLHAGLLHLALTWLGLGPYAGVVLGLCVVPAFSFALNRAWVFRPARPPRGDGRHLPSG